MMDDADFLRELELLKQKYAKNIETRLNKIRKFLAAFHEQGRIKHLVDIARELHSLAGSAKTFGFSETSVVAKKYENQVKYFLENMTNGQVFDSQDFIKCIDKLEKTTITHRVAQVDGKV